MKEKKREKKERGKIYGCSPITMSMKSEHFMFVIMWSRKIIIIIIISEKKSDEKRKF